MFLAHWQSKRRLHDNVRRFIDISDVFLWRIVDIKNGIDETEIARN